MPFVKHIYSASKQISAAISPGLWTFLVSHDYFSSWIKDGLNGEKKIWDLFSTHYKFIIDGEWRHDEHQPFVIGNYGTINTVILTREPDYNSAVLSPHINSGSSMDVDNGAFQRVENSEWNEWQGTVLQERNMVENVYRWACGQPTSIHDRNRDSDEDDINHDRDYDVAALANNLSQAFRYNVYDNEEGEEGHVTLGQGDEQGYFDDESAEVVISSLRLGDDQGSSLFTNSNWFAFQDDKMGDTTMTTASPSELMDDINLNEASTVGNPNNDDDLVAGVDEDITDNKISNSTPSRSPNPFSEDYVANDKTSASDVDFFKFESTDNEDLFADRPMPEWVGWGEPVGGSGVNPFEDYNNTPNLDIPNAPETPVGVGLSVSTDLPSLPNGSSSDESVASDSSQKEGAVPSLFEEDVEFVGVESDGTEKAMDKALKEGIVGEAGALKRKVTPPSSPSAGEKDNDSEANKEFNDSNYWRVDQEISVSE